MKGFWSLTLYNAENFFHANELNRFSLGTKNKDLQFGADGSLTLYLGAKSPGKDKESNWLPAPNGHVLAVVAKLLAGAGGHRRHIRAAGGSEGGS